MKLLLDTLTSAERKTYPMYEGLLKYFPNALAAVAHVSYASNEKHNPGEPMHWSREKSKDHKDCILRHLAQVGTVDAEDNIPHSWKLAWRALANAELEIEEYLKQMKAPAPEPDPESLMVNGLDFPRWPYVYFPKAWQRIRSEIGTEAFAQQFRPVTPREMDEHVARINRVFE